MDLGKLSPTDAARVAKAEAFVAEAMRRAGVAPSKTGTDITTEEGDRIMHEMLAMGARPIDFGSRQPDGDQEEQAGPVR